MEDRVKTEFSGGTLTCRLFGDIDHHAEEKMRDKIDRELYKYRPKVLLLDFSAVGFTDSSGLGLIMGRRRSCEELAVRMSLVGVSRDIERLLTLTGLIREIEIIQKKRTVEEIK
jgi:stage II sporulation protein AA (anti-sigma F factor antagonist)